MNNTTSIIKKVFPICISLCLVLCLVFSSFSAYLVENILNQDLAKTETSISNLQQGNVHHTQYLKNTFIAEVADSEDDNSSNKKNSSLLFVKILKVLWSSTTIEKKNIEAVQYAEHPTEKTNAYKYIEYCSLKIPS